MDAADVERLGGEGLCDTAAMYAAERWGFCGVQGVRLLVADRAQAVRTGAVFVHWWNVLADGSVFDATAGQFGGPLVQVFRPWDAEALLYVDGPPGCPQFCELSAAAWTSADFGMLDRVRAACPTQQQRAHNTPVDAGP